MKTPSRLAVFATSAFLLIAPFTALGQSGPPPGFEGMMPPEGMMSGGQDMEKMGLQQLKGRLRGMKVPVQQLEKTIAKVQKAGYEVSQDVLDALAKGKAAIATIENAESMEDAQAALEDFSDFAETVGEVMEPLNMLANFPRILKQADRTFKKLNTMFNKNKAKAEKGEVDLSGVIAGIQAKIDALKVAFEKAQTEAKSGNAAEAFRLLEEEYFENMEDAFQSVGMLQASSNLTKAAKMVAKGIAKAEKTVARFEKKGEDMTAAKEVIAGAKQKLEELKAMLAESDFEPETAVELLEELDGLREDFEKAVEEATGQDLSGKDSVNFFNMRMPSMPKEMMGPPMEPGGAPF